MHVTEENVVEQLKFKNEEAIAYILQTYGGLLNAIIRKYFHSNQQDVEECLSDVLASVWFHIDSFNPSKNEFKQWIAAIAKYRAIDYARKKVKEKQRMSHIELDERFIDGSGSVSNSYNFEMDSVFNKLSEEEQMIFKKYYIEGVPTREIATQFKARPSWVHNKLSRGRKKLKNMLLRSEG